MAPDIICFSHLRWNFVYQRPQHLMSRFGHSSRVFFIEEPVYDTLLSGFKVVRPSSATNVTVLTPHVSPAIPQASQEHTVSLLLDEFLKTHGVENFIAWFYSPMAIVHIGNLQPLLTVYDCMDELSGFLFAPTLLKEREAELFKIADVVFTGGHTLFEFKKNFHHTIFPFPSSIDKAHFSSARKNISDAPDQSSILHPRLGFYGVLDERLDLKLLDDIASLRPDWNLIMIGPVVKIDPATLPRRHNIFYLGSKSYDELPSYLAGWDIAIMPFALNASTAYISPTKTPEYLAGGKPVISTPITDVVNDYGKKDLVSIAATAQEFVDKGDEILNLPVDLRRKWLSAVDKSLSEMSWDNTWQKMKGHLDNALANKKISERSTSLKYV